MKRLITLTALSTLPALALAHGDAGHTFMSNLQHVLSSAIHLWPLAVTALVAATLKRPVQRLMRQRTHRD